MSEQNATAARPEPVSEAETPAPVDDRRAALEAEVAELKDRMLRTLAEMENLRRRTDREIADQRQYGISSFAREMLIVADNLKRAIAAVPPDARSADPALSNLMDGVEATERGLQQTLGKFGVKPIEAKGQKFDPAFHQAMYEVEDASVPAGIVVEVVQPGYRISERMLRPALVAVAKGGQKKAAEDEKEPAAEVSAGPTGEAVG